MTDSRNSGAFRIGIVGATGLVGETFLKILKDSPYSFSELRLFTSEKSAGQNITFRDQTYTCQTLQPGCFDGLSVVFFSSGDEISKEWAPKAVESGAYAIDNSAAFRMDADTPLVVPEINFDSVAFDQGPQIIANPNCSTIQLVMVLHALRKFHPEEVRVATYQSVSGAGTAGIKDLMHQTRESLENGKTPQGEVFKKAIAFECQPVIGSLNEEHFCSEEVKITKETKKILDRPDMKVSASTVRVPTPNGHGESLWVTLKDDVTRPELFAAFESAPYITVAPSNEPDFFHSYSGVTGESNAFISRIRKDSDFPRTWLMWILADNLYRGAAANGYLIAQRIFDKALGQ